MTKKYYEPLTIPSMQYNSLYEEYIKKNKLVDDRNATVSFNNELRQKFRVKHIVIDRSDLISDATKLKDAYTRVIQKQTNSINA
jgi:hypothetical protein